MKNKIIAFILVLMLTNLSFSQNAISLLEKEKVTDYLELEFLMYDRYGDYKYYTDYSSSNTALRFYIRHII